MRSALLDTGALVAIVNRRDRSHAQLTALLNSGRLAIMSDTDVAEILKLPAEERLRLVEIIWASLVTEPSSVPLGDVQRAVIDERLAEHERNPDDVVSRGEVLAEARRG